MYMRTKLVRFSLLLAGVVIVAFAQSTIRVVLVTSDGQITQAALASNVVVDFTTSPPTLKAVNFSAIDQKRTQNAGGSYSLPAGTPATSKVIVYRNGVRQREGNQWDRVGTNVVPKTSWATTDEVTMDVFPQ